LFIAPDHKDVVIASNAQHFHAVDGIMENLFVGDANRERVLHSLPPRAAFLMADMTTSSRLSASAAVLPLTIKYPSRSRMSSTGRASNSRSRFKSKCRNQSCSNGGNLTGPYHP